MNKAWRVISQDRSGRTPVQLLHLHEEPEDDASFEGPIECDLFAGLEIVCKHEEHLLLGGPVVHYDFVSTHS